MKLHPLLKEEIYLYRHSIRHFFFFSLIYFWSSDQTADANTYEFTCFSQSKTEKSLDPAVYTGKISMCEFYVTKVSWEIHMKISHEIRMNFMFVYHWDVIWVHLSVFLGFEPPLHTGIFITCYAPVSTDISRFFFTKIK